jgi:hypothetical protein
MQLGDTDARDFPAATDYTQFSLLPKLIGYISKAAPNIRITVFPSENKIPTEKSSTIKSQAWLQDSYRTIV